MLEHQNNKTCYFENFITTIPAVCRTFFKIFLKKAACETLQTYISRARYT